jgi:hypothetical protein
MKANFFLFKKPAYSCTQTAIKMADYTKPEHDAKLLKLCYSETEIWIAYSYNKTAQHAQPNNQLS